MWGIPSEKGSRGGVTSTVFAASERKDAGYGFALTEQVDGMLAAAVLWVGPSLKAPSSASEQMAALDLLNPQPSIV